MLWKSKVDEYKIGLYMQAFCNLFMPSGMLLCNLYLKQMVLHQMDMTCLQFTPAHLAMLHQHCMQAT